MADVTLDLKEVLDDLDNGRLITADRADVHDARRARRVAILAAAVAALAGAGLWWFGIGRGLDATWTVRPLTTLPGLEQQPVLSPKGEYVAFVWDGGRLDDHDIYVQQVSGATPPFRVTNHPARESSPTWSPDGNQLAFLRESGDGADVIVASHLGGAERKLGHVSRSTFVVMALLPPSKIDWSPDGQFIALGTATLSLLKVATGELLQLPVAPSPGTDRDPSFSPDGRSIAYTRGTSLVARQIWTQRIRPDGSADGAPVLVTHDYRWVPGLTWKDSSSLLTGTGWAGSLVRLLQVSTSGRERLLPVESVAAWYPSYSTADHRLVYQRRTIDTDVMRLDLVKGGAPMDTHPLIMSTFQEFEAKYSPDGTKIAFISTRSGQQAIWRANADGTNQILLASLEDMMPGSPRWLPDGTGVVFDASSPVSGVDVYTVSAEGGTPRQVTSLPGEESAPSVSRDGRSVYYCSQGVLFKTPLAGGQPVRVAEGIRRDGQESFDGRWVYYVRANDLWRKPIGSGTEERFQSNVPFNGWALTPKEVFVLRPGGQTPGSIVAYDLDTRRERLVRELPRELRLFSATWLDVKQDGSAALISPIVRDESDIVLVDGIR
jgi:Tol biopolymer transport system component